MQTESLEIQTSRQPSEALPLRGDLALIFGVLSLVTLAAGGLLTLAGIGPWYENLQVPSFQPPAWAFTPTWTLIFFLLAAASWRIARHGRRARFAIQLYAVQLVLNAAWSLFFFPMQMPWLALVDGVLLTALVGLMIVSYGRIDRTAGAMLVPYAVWMCFATAINLWIVLYN